MTPADIRAPTDRLDQQRAAANLQVRLAELRRALRPVGEADRLATRPPGYQLETLTANYALRERFWSQRLLALYRCGRQADALRASRELRTILVGQLGIEPGPELRELEARILRQDARLDFRPAGHTEGDDKARPETRYVDSGGVHIAYQVLGRGERDIVFVPGALSHLDLLWEDPETADF